MPENDDKRGNGKHPGGAPKGSRNRETHGLATLRNAIHKRLKRGRSFIDLRCESGQNAVAVQAGLVADLGGMENISTAQKLLIELIGRDVYLLDESDQCIVKAIREQPRFKNSPKNRATLYSYRIPPITNIVRSLLALGLEKRPPPQKSLDDLLEEAETEQQGDEPQSDGDHE
jgi:hypothetical protein